jgi:hypothetical protein
VRDSQSTTEVVRTSPERRGAHVEVKEKAEKERGEKQSKREMGQSTFLPLAGPVPVALARSRTAASVRTAEERETEEVKCAASALKDSREDR